MMLKLSSHRTAALQNLLANNHQVALATLAHSLIDGLSRRYRSSTCPLALRTLNVRPALLNNTDDIATARGWLELDARLDAFSDKIDAVEDNLFGWLLTQTIEELVGIIALCCAVNLTVVTGDCAHQPATDLASALALNMADWWQPTASFLSDLSKDKIINAVAEACGAEHMMHLDKLKKPELIKVVEQKMRGTRWLPSPLG